MRLGARIFAGNDAVSRIGIFAQLREQHIGAVVFAFGKMRLSARIFAGNDAVSRVAVIAQFAKQRVGVGVIAAGEIFLGARVLVFEDAVSRIGIFAQLRKQHIGVAVLPSGKILLRALIFALQNAVGCIAVLARLLKQRVGVGILPTREQLFGALIFALQNALRTVGIIAGQGKQRVGAIVIAREQAGLGARVLAGRDALSRVGILAQRGKQCVRLVIAAFRQQLLGVFVGLLSARLRHQFQHFVCALIKPKLGKQRLRLVQLVSHQVVFGTGELAGKDLLVRIGIAADLPQQRIGLAVAARLQMRQRALILAFQNAIGRIRIIAQRFKQRIRPVVILLIKQSGCIVVDTLLHSGQALGRIAEILQRSKAVHGLHVAASRFIAAGGIILHQLGTVHVLAQFLGQRRSVGILLFISHTACSRINGGLRLRHALLRIAK